MPAVPIVPAKLVEVAWHLARSPGGVGRPKPVWLRRATSSAYYALFHCISTEAAKSLLSRGSRQDQLRMTRSFEHGALRTVCNWIAGRTQAPAHVQSLVLGLQGTTIDGVANVFIDLQEQRHAADYDHLAPFSRAGVFAAIQDAERAMQSLTAASAQERQAFYSLLTLKTSAR